MKRLFVGLEIPAELKMQLSFMTGGIPGAKWVDKENFHITLRYIGEVDSLMEAQIQQCLDRILRPTFSLQFKGVGHFPPRGHPTVLWAGIAKSKALLDLQETIDRALIKIGCEPEPRKFFPHMTLARLHSSPEAKVAIFLNQHSLMEFDPFEVSEFYLYQSHLHPQGASYEILAKFELETAG